MFYIQYVIEFIKYLYRNCPYMGVVNDVPPFTHPRKPKGRS